MQDDLNDTQLPAKKAQNQSLPKPAFSEVGRFYQAVISAGLSPGSLNRDRADTLVRTLSRTSWKNDNMDIYRIWNSQGESWGQLIKDVKSYSRDVSKHRRKKPAT